MRRVEPRRDEQPGHAGQRAAERVDQQLDAIDLQAAEQRRALVAADRVDVPAEARAPRHDDEQRHQRGADPDRHRHAEPLPGADERRTTRRAR